MIVAGTGHRPDKLGGYGADAGDRLLKLAIKSLIRLKPTKVISGMALGWDQALARAALDQKIPLIAAVPFKGQQSKWPPASQKEYNIILSQPGVTVQIVCEGGYAAWKMSMRNMWMVNKCDLLLALFNGTSGGTANCVKYAEEVKKPIDNVWAEFVEICSENSKIVGKENS